MFYVLGTPLSNEIKNQPRHSHQNSKIPHHSSPLKKQQNSNLDNFHTSRIIDAKFTIANENLHKQKPQYSRNGSTVLNYNSQFNSTEISNKPTEMSSTRSIEFINYSNGSEVGTLPNFDLAFNLFSTMHQHQHQHQRRTYSTDDKVRSKAIIKLWSNFIKTG